MTTGSTYKVVELVGTSSEGIDQAIEGAIARGWTNTEWVGLV